MVDRADYKTCMPGGASLRSSVSEAIGCTIPGSWNPGQKKDPPEADLNQGGFKTVMGNVRPVTIEVNEKNIAGR